MEGSSRQMMGRPGNPVKRGGQFLTLTSMLQQLVHERVRLGPIYEYIWPSGIGPRVAEPAFLMINPYPWSAPLEEVRLKKN